MALALNSSHDIYMVDGGLAQVTGKDLIAQDLNTRLSIFLGEYKYNTSEGTAWFQEIFVKPFDIAIAETVLKTRILETYGVRSLNAFLLDYEGGVARKLTLTFQVTTIDGDSLTIEDLEVPNV